MNVLEHDLGMHLIWWILGQKCHTSSIIHQYSKWHLVSLVSSCIANDLTDEKKYKNEEPSKVKEMDDQGYQKLLDESRFEDWWIRAFENKR